MAALNFARSFPFPPHRQHMGQGGATIIDSMWTPVIFFRSSFDA